MALIVGLPAIAFAEDPPAPPSPDAGVPTPVDAPADAPPDSGSDAAAHPAPPDAAPAPVVSHSLAETDAAPLPGSEGGRIDQVDDGDGVGRVLLRIPLYIPRLLVDIVYYPIHGLFLLTDRFHIDKLYYQVFYNANHTIGLVPVVVFESGFGLSVGGRFVASNIFGEKERFSAQATTGFASGNTHREGFIVDLNTGQRLGKHFSLGLVGNFSRRPGDPFYGIGNGDDTDAKPATPVNALTDPTSYEADYRYREERVALTAEIKPSADTHIKVTGALTDLAYEVSDSGRARIDEVYQTSSLVGFDDGVQHAYGELELKWDTRHPSSVWEPEQMFSKGSLVSLFGGRVHRLDEGTDFWRYGLELQHFFRLGRGPRTLSTRFRASGVTAPRDEVPFSELPLLGGGDFLRGYSYNRFRDRVAAFGTLQYEWDLSHFTSAYIFSDFGRVYESVQDATLSGLRVGYGLGVSVYGESSFLFTAMVASSIDGGLFFNLSFNQPINGLQTWR